MEVGGLQQPSAQYPGKSRTPFGAGFPISRNTTPQFDGVERRVESSSRKQHNGRRRVNTRHVLRPRAVKVVSGAGETTHWLSPRSTASAVAGTCPAAADRPRLSVGQLDTLKSVSGLLQAHLPDRRMVWRRGCRRVDLWSVGVSDRRRLGQARLRRPNCGAAVGTEWQHRAGGQTEGGRKVGGRWAEGGRGRRKDSKWEGRVRHREGEEACHTDINTADARPPCSYFECRSPIEQPTLRVARTASDRGGRTAREQAHSGGGQAGMYAAEAGAGKQRPGDGRVGGRGRGCGGSGPCKTQRAVDPRIAARARRNVPGRLHAHARPCRCPYACVPYVVSAHATCPT
jgi:hypothetical protein